MDAGESDLGSVLAPDEAALVTSDGMTDLSLMLPQMHENAEIPELVVFLTACMMRWQTEPEFVAEQLGWFAEQTRQ